MKKTQIISLGILLIISALLGFATLTGGHNWPYSDFASYVMQAESVLEWDMDSFIAHNTITIEESDVPVGPIAYPWGYPLMLVPIIALRGLSPLSMKLLNTLLFLLFQLVLYFLARKRLSHLDSLLLIALFAVNPIFLEAQDFILSDIAFLFLSTLAIFLMDYWDVHERKYLHHFLIGLAAFAAFLTRTNGLLLLPSLIAYEVFFAVKRRDLRSSVSRWLPPTIIFLILWLLFSLIFPDGQASHLDRFGEFQFSQLWTFSLAYVNMAAQFFADVPAAKIFYGLFVVFFLIGLAKKFRENLLLILYFFATLALYILWPYLQGIRFLFSILPFFVLIAFQGIKVVAGWLPANISGVFTFGYRAVIVAIAVVMLSSSSQHALQNLADHREVHGPFDDVATDMFEAVKKKTPEDSRIIFFKPRVMRLMTGRDSILVLSCENLPKADYVVINLKWDDMGQIAPEEIEACATPLTKIYENRRFVLYQIGD